MARRVTAPPVDRWQAVEDYLRTEEPSLRLLRADDGSWARIVGSVALDVGDGEIEHFQITIEYAHGDPKCVPDVYTADRVIPSDLDNHVEPDGRFCMWLPIKAPRHRLAQRDGLQFLLGRVREFLDLQRTYMVRKKFDMKPYWVGPEWAHGDAAYEQWARETADGLTAVQIKALMRWVLRSPARQSVRCACGSGSRYGNCHKGWVKDLRYALEDPKAQAAWYLVRKELA